MGTVCFQICTHRKKHHLHSILGENREGESIHDKALDKHKIKNILLGMGKHILLKVSVFYFWLPGVSLFNPPTVGVMPLGNKLLRLRQHLGPSGRKMHVFFHFTGIVAIFLGKFLPGRVLASVCSLHLCHHCHEAA